MIPVDRYWFNPWCYIISFKLYISPWHQNSKIVISERMISSKYYLFSPRGAFCRDLRLLFSSICRLQNNDRVAGNWVGYLGIYLVLEYLARYYIQIKSEQRWEGWWDTVHWVVLIDLSHIWKEQTLKVTGGRSAVPNPSFVHTRYRQVHCSLDGVTRVIWKHRLLD